MPRRDNTVSTRRLLHTGLENYDHVDLDAGEVFSAAALKSQRRPCCGVPPAAFEHEGPRTIREPGQVEVRWLHLQICPHCGWWHYQRDMGGELDGRPGQISLACGCGLRVSEVAHLKVADVDSAWMLIRVEQGIRV